MTRWSIKQKQLVAEFLSNFALAWLTFGLIAPIFSGVENVFYFVIRLTMTIGIFYLSLKVATKILK